MLTVGLLTLLAFGALAMCLALASARRWRVEALFARLAWIPVAALLVQAALFVPLMKTFSYGFVAFPIMTCVISVVLGAMGATLVAAARQRGEAHAGLLRSTLIASIPAMLLAGYVVFAFAERMVRSGQ